MLIDLYADTKRGYLGFGDFFIESSGDGWWDWCHKDFRTNGSRGTCQTLFAALEAAHAASEQMLSDKLDRQSNAADAAE